MPWHWLAMKDVANCDKPRGAVNTLGSGDFRIGQPTPQGVSLTESIG